MTMTQTTMEQSPTGDPHCPHCKAVLPPHAAFCASCGERIVKNNTIPLLQNEKDIATRYRISSLVRRRPYVSLFFAIDNQQQRPVAIREINIRDLNDEARATACAIAQSEYDLLRRERIPSIMPVIDLRHFQGHLYHVAGWPIKTGEKTSLQTLQDVLQSGIGRPDTQVVLSWIKQLCLSLEQLHRHSIILGDLDPHALIFRGNSYDSELALMVSWLPPSIRDLLPSAPAISNTTNFSAPEVLLGKPEPPSDTYSLGAVLYLLLTGTEPALRTQRHLRLPGEINPRVNSSLDEIVMKALSIESADRYQSAIEMSEALSSLHSGHTVRKGQQNTPEVFPAHTFSIDINIQERKLEEIVNTDTARITPSSSPEKGFVAWQPPKRPESAPPQSAEQSPTIVEGELQRKAEKGSTPQAGEMQASLQRPTNKTASTRSPFVQSFKKRITGVIPAIRISTSTWPKISQRTVAKPSSMPVTPEPSSGTSSNKDRSLLEQLQRLVLGKQQHGTTAAAIIETPLRVQPNQPYTIRIQLMGRDQSALQQQSGPLRTDSKKGAPTGGLSTLIEGQLVYIEVRSALYQNYAIIVQQAAVYIPAHGYAAEVTIPMHPLSSGPTGRRDRLHIYFMDEMRRPLYEKPFVVELFISPLVQPGREGHNVLTIPL